MEGARLIEPGVKYWILQTLKESSKHKYISRSITGNILIAAALIIFVGGFITYKYYTKLTPQEKAANARDKNGHLLSTMLTHKVDTYRKNEDLITDMPIWDMP